MKMRLVILSVGLAASLGFLAPGTQAAISFSAGIEIKATADFHDPLAEAGAWVDIGGRGSCWRPRGVAADWRPYVNGSWEWTDAGWYWASDEPWAWACYHYGSWIDDPSAGWAWIPGTDWAPAWVTWRCSDDYIGWAPCGPDLAIPAPSLFAFVDIHHFQEPIRPASVIINNATIINRTTVVHEYPRQTRTINGVSQTVVTDPGPGIDRIQRATGAKLSAQPLERAVEKTPKPARLAHQPEPARTPAESGDQRRPIQEPAGAQAQPERQQQERKIAPTPSPTENREAAPKEPVEQPKKPAPQIEQKTTPPATERPDVQDRTIREPSGAQADRPVQKEPAPAPPMERREAAPPTQRPAPDSKREAAPVRTQPAPPSQKPESPAPDREKDKQQP